MRLGEGTPVQRPSPEPLCPHQTRTAMQCSHWGSCPNAAQCGGRHAEPHRPHASWGASTLCPLQLSSKQFDHSRLASSICSNDSDARVEGDSNADALKNLACCVGVTASRRLHQPFSTGKAQWRSFLIDNSRILQL